MSRPIRIANAGGYWGDDPDAPRRQLLGGPIDYLTIDALAEVTMVILEKLRAKDPSRGYATDVVGSLAPLLPELARRGVRVVTNAGGVNPDACADALEAAAKTRGLSPRIAVVGGAEVDAARLAPPHADTGEPFSGIAPFVATSHAYLGARGIAMALGKGAEIVVTGRVADASLVLGPLVHEHGWRWDDWDRLAAGTIAGHVLECGAQATGGNLTDWRGIPFDEIGYPITEVAADGRFAITKHPGSGGRVSRETVTEQLLYEIGDPRRYETPDVTADFTSIAIRDDGADRVVVEGARGTPAPVTLKAGVSWSAGWRSAGTYLVGPPDAEEKARALAQLLWKRAGRFDETSTELFGGAHAFLRLAVRDADRQKVEAFSRRFASYALSGPPGLTIPGGGRPPVVEAFGFWPARIARESVAPWVSIGGERIAYDESVVRSGEAERPAPRVSELSEEEVLATGRRVPLVSLAFARSGDKGDNANIGVAARSESAYRALGRVLTPDLVRSAFAAECAGEVRRCELPNLLAFNFVLTRALGGGGTLSLRSDPQGKLFAQRLLATEVVL
ncbi:MAG TPA: acyclic terpene utilization AtuA family protein [Thermoanaerobaculia bacterium]|nr:acyclic terpene utilization AtuA family protein [Thermoanaerobaculia bacterium]